MKYTQNLQIGKLNIDFLIGASKSKGLYRIAKIIAAV
jgi:hypothetical protein